MVAWLVLALFGADAPADMLAERLAREAKPALRREGETIFSLVEILYPEWSLPSDGMGGSQYGQCGPSPGRGHEPI